MPRKSLLPGLLLVILPFGGAARCLAATDALSWAEKMAESEMKRRGDSLAFGKDSKAKWAYETGVFLKGLDAVGARTGDKKYAGYVKAVIDSYLEPDGSIRTYKLEDYTLDNINCGKLLLTLYQSTRDEKYRQAAVLLMKQLENQPRTKEGGFWHKEIYPYQMWLDGIYMASPFLAQFAQIFNRPAGFDEVANQIIWMENHARDRQTGLLYHGWDESRTQEWADPHDRLLEEFLGPGDGLVRHGDRGRPGFHAGEASPESRAGQYSCASVQSRDALPGQGDGPMVSGRRPRQERQELSGSFRFVHVRLYFCQREPERDISTLSLPLQPGKVSTGSSIIWSRSMRTAASVSPRSAASEGLGDRKKGTERSHTT